MAEPETLALGRAAPSEARATLEQIFELSYRRLAMQLYGVVGNLAEAEDLVQEAFVRAAAAGPRFRRVDNPEAWLRRTAINLHRKRWRKVRNFHRTARDSRCHRRTCPGSTSTSPSSRRCASCRRPSARRLPCTTSPTCRSPRSQTWSACPRAR